MAQNDRQEGGSRRGLGVLRSVLRLVHIAAWGAILILAVDGMLGAAGTLEALKVAVAATASTALWYVVGLALGIKAHEKQPA